MGEGGSVLSAIRGRVFSLLALLRPLMGQIARVACSPVTEAAIGCTGQCTSTVLRASPSLPRSMTAWSSKTPTSRATVHCAPPDNKPMREEIEACRGYLVRELEALSDMKVVLVLGRVAFDGFLAAWRESGREGSEAEAQIRSRLRRRACWRRAASRQLPPEPAEHVYRKAHPSDVPGCVREGARSRRRLINSDPLRAPARGSYTYPT